MNWKQPVPNVALLQLFLLFTAELEAFKNGSKTLVVDGQHLSISAIAALSRLPSAPVTCSSDPHVINRVEAARSALQSMIDKKISVYGVNTGPGGSSDTRTPNLSALGLSLLQLQLAGVLPVPSERKHPSDLSQSPTSHTNVMPESWVRAAILVRANALIRGHSGVRMELIHHLLLLLRCNIIPLVPIRGSISASGDLQPLAYVAATLIGSPAVRVYNGPERIVIPASRALESHSIIPTTLAPKEHLGLLNGTSFSAGLSAIVLHDSLQLTVLAEVLTALGTEALLGTRASHYAFIHETCRPHLGQVEVARTVLWLLEGSKFATGNEDALLEGDEVTAEGNASLKQDRYALRTSPQFLGPQIEEILSAVKTIEIECNSSTDNPLIDSTNSRIHQGGNFQAMSATSAMEKTRLALFHIGKLLFAQSTEICNPATNNGLPPSVAATDPSLNFHAKGLDIATAAYVGELGWLAGPVGVHAQSAEMHNQAVNSLALISARATADSLDVLSMLMATYLYILCQALDLRALQAEHTSILRTIVSSLLVTSFPPCLYPYPCELDVLEPVIQAAVSATLSRTSTLDAEQRMENIASACAAPLIAHFTAPARSPVPTGILEKIASFQKELAARGAASLRTLRSAYLLGKRGPAPATPYLGRTAPLYSYVREVLGVPMHGRQNLELQTEGGAGLSLMEETVGAEVSVIYEVIKSGEIGTVLERMFRRSELMS